MIYGPLITAKAPRARERVFRHRDVRYAQTANVEYTATMTELLSHDRTKRLTASGTCRPLAAGQSSRRPSPCRHRSRVCSRGPSNHQKQPASTPEHTVQASRVSKRNLPSKRDRANGRDGRPRQRAETWFGPACHARCASGRQSWHGLHSPTDFEST